MAYLIHDLEMVQRRAARFIFNDWRRTSSVTAMMEQLNWQSLETRRLHIRLTMMYKISKQLVAINKENYLAEPTRHTRSAYPGTFMRFQCNKDALNYSFFPQTVRDWNLLSKADRESSTLEGFKHAIRAHGPTAPVRAVLSKRD